MESVYTIEKIVPGGLGLSRTSTGIVFIPDVLPGEIVAAFPYTTIGGTPLARLTRIIEPSLYRRTPVCPYYGLCGGCDLMHCTYDQQITIKKALFLDCMTRIGKIHSMPACEVFVSPELGYRRRVQIKLDRVSKTAGFYKKKSHDVVAFDSCPLLVEPLNHLLNDIRSADSVFTMNSDQIKVIAGTDGSIASSPIVNKYTQKTTTINVGDRSFIVAGDSFFQGNSFLCQTLGTWAHGKLAEGYCADLYGGLGFFSVLLGQDFTAGVLVDSLASQVALAQLNFNRNGLTHFTVKALHVERFLATIQKGASSVNCCIIDPPRTGLTPMVRQGLARLNADCMLYISCNPATQARDIAYFVHTCGYILEQCALFDLYPNTYHMETAVILRRSQ